MRPWVHVAALELNEDDNTDSEDNEMSDDDTESTSEIVPSII